MRKEKNEVIETPIVLLFLPMHLSFCFQYNILNFSCKSYKNKINI